MASPWRSESEGSTPSMAGGSEGVQPHLLQALQLRGAAHVEHLDPFS